MAYALVTMATVQVMVARAQALRPYEADVFEPDLTRLYSYRGLKMLKYKVIELSTVSEDMLEEVLNEWSAKGWTLDGIHFAMRESQKRPSMAFVVFTIDESRS